MAIKFQAIAEKIEKKLGIFFAATCIENHPTSLTNCFQSMSSEHCTAPL